MHEWRLRATLTRDVTLARRELSAPSRPTGYAPRRAMRPREFLDVIESPELPRYERADEQAEMLRHLLVHLFFADLDFDRRELTLLQRVLPAANTREYVTALATRRLDLDRLAALFPEARDRADIVALAEHAMSSDGKIEHREWHLVDRLKDRLGVPRESPP